jgi:hypothetical protein
MKHPVRTQVQICADVVSGDSKLPIVFRFKDGNAYDVEVVDNRS